MLTKITAYSQWSTVDPLVLNVVNRPDTDLFEVRNVDGLGAVKADVSTARMGSVPGAQFMGSSTGARNIVLTLGPTPDWETWTMSKLRRELDRYFMPEQTIRLVLETQEFSPVEIFGYIEANEPQIFSKDPEHQVSIICPGLYFRSVDPVVIEGVTNQSPVLIDYEGNVETGIVVTVERPGTEGGTQWYETRVNDPLQNYIRIPPIFVSSDVEYIMSSVAGDKYIKNVYENESVANLLNIAEIVDDNTRDPRWPMIGPGTIDFEVATNHVSSPWTLSFHNLFGSL